MTGAQIGRGLRVRPPLIFFENRKNCPDFGKKTLIVSIFFHWIKFYIQNVISKVSWRKTPKCFNAGLFFHVFNEMFFEVP